ncbi:MAG: sugar kinase [Congregibacter sp.]
MAKRIAMIGECMLELTRPPSQQVGGSLPMNLSYGGDTLNSAVYLARQGVQVDYVTALGDDSLSAWMVGEWRAEGVGCDLVQYAASAVPGLYLIETDADGERSFHYWRESSAARRLLEDPENAERLFSELANHHYICLSGITLAIYSPASRQRLFDHLIAYRHKGGKVVFDGNYRPRLWESEDATRHSYEQMYRITDIALPTLDEEQGLFGLADQSAFIARLRSWGVREMAIKLGASGCLVVGDAEPERIAARKVDVVDTTSAGDSFNAGYLAARMSGRAPDAAVRAGQHLASIVIQHQGAIIPADAMPGEHWV